MCIWSILALNIVVPLIWSVTNACWILELSAQNDSVSPFLTVAIDIEIVVVGLLLITTGVILVKSVVAIRKYIEQNEPGSLNTRSIYVHMLAFALFLVGCICFSVPYLLSYIFSSNHTIKELARIGLAINLILNLAS